MEMEKNNQTNEEHVSLSHHGPILGMLIVILIVILGGLYLWGSMLEKNEVEIVPIVNNEPETPRAKTDVEISRVLSPSDELDAIEADIKNTNLDAIDADVQAIDAETGSST